MDDSRPSNARRYAESVDFLKRAEAVIPLGSQTFSKSRTQFPVGAAPLFVERAAGPYFWDVDGNRYLDFACSLGAITMGHGDPDVRAAVVRQMDEGVLFSLPNPIETRVAEMIVERIPCSEKVRFGKNGSDATAGAVRLARAYTGRDRVALCGYHGWQDWYIGTTARNRGVPEQTRSMSHTFPYNDLDALDRLLASHKDEFACVIMEPVAFTEPTHGYLQGVKDIAHKHGALLIFDEVVTGFRYAPGSAQELYGVTPDLCSLGKGLANGFPLSAIAGRADVMKLMEEIFFSFTMGGEAISLAATEAVLAKSKREKTLDHIAETGSYLIERFRALVDKHNLGDVLSISGHPSWTLIGMKDQPGADSFALKTLYIQETCRRGLFSFGVHFLSYAFQKEHVDEAMAIYDEVFPIMRRAVDSGDFRSFLECDPLVPLFKVR